MKTVAIFGGSFEPPHIGHKRIVIESLKILKINKIVIVPTFINPFKKKSYFKPSEKLKMSKIFFNFNKKIYISDFEIKSKKKIETYKTIKFLQNSYIVKYIIIGSDNLELLTKWGKFYWLNNNFTWIIATRKNYLLNIKFLNRYKILNIKENISSTEIRNQDIKKFI